MIAGSSQRYLIFFLFFMVVSHAQVIQFLNITYLPSDPMNEEVYECKSLTNRDILSMVWKYIDLFDKKTVISFGKWCANKVDFTAAHSKRRQCDSGKVSVRSLFVAKEQYIGKIIFWISFICVNPIFR